MRRSLVVGNWKMNGSSSQLQDLLSELLNLELSTLVDTVVCPTSIYLSAAKQQLAETSIGVGAQNVAEYTEGAYTGEISAAMLADIGLGFAIVGHSERREIFKEASQQVAQKTVRCIESGLTPIVCVGETLAQRESEQTLAVIAEQLEAVLDKVDDISKLVVAYEPVWAIGTGKTATPEQAQAVHAFIRERLAKADVSAAAELRILYGGSVKPANAAELFAQPDIDGGLIGGASLEAQSFAAIVNAAG